MYMDVCYYMDLFIKYVCVYMCTYLSVQIFDCFHRQK